MVQGVPDGDLGAGVEAELGKNVFDMHFGGPPGDH
jgi:hypothetical protein